MRFRALTLITLVSAINCGDDTHPDITIGGTVTGLSGGVLVLQNGSGDKVPVSADGAFTFTTPVLAGANYAVTVATQPTGPVQACAVTNGVGKVTGGNVTDVTVTCSTSAFVVGGTVTGLTGTGLVLQDNGGDDLAVGSDGSFSFPTKVASYGAFSVSVATQPSGPTQTCTVSGATGTVISANVSTVVVNCATDSFTIGGMVTGLAGALVLQNGSDEITVAANGSFAFPTPVASNTMYSVTVVQDPMVPDQTCTLGHETGTVGGENVTSVTVSCTTNSFTIGGTLHGLAAGESITLQDNGSDDLTLGSDEAFQFQTAVPSGQPYDVTVSAQPATQTCTVSGGDATVGGGAVGGVQVTCSDTLYNVDVTVTGLGSGGVFVLQDNGNDNLGVTANGTFAFQTQIANGGGYHVTLAGQPTGQLCEIVDGAGAISAGDASVTVTCGPAPCFSFANDANENLIGNDWFTTCANAVGNTVVVDLLDGGGQVMYHATGQKVGTWTPNNLLTSTDATQSSFGGGYTTTQYDPSDHDQLITLDTGDQLMITGQSAAQAGCGGSLGDGYSVQVYQAPASYPAFSPTLKLLVAPYQQQNLFAGQPRSFAGWSMNTEISWNGGTPMQTCDTAVTGFDGTFSFTVLP